MCADAEFATTGLTLADLPALTEFAVTHGIMPVDCSDRLGGLLRGSLLRLVDGKGVCWCSFTHDDIDGLRAVLRWLAERGRTTFRPDGFHYLKSGEETVTPEEVAPPVTGDGRVLTISVEEAKPDADEY